MTTPPDLTPTTGPDRPSNAELMALAERLAREAGDLVRAGRARGVEVAATKSTVVDVVTAVDLASEELLRRRVAEHRPGDGFLGEEGDDVSSSTGLTWVVDPIDGTVNFLYDLQSYAVAVAVVSGEPTPGTWQVLASCVLRPSDGTCWTAARGVGAFRDGERITVAPARPLAETLLATGFGYDPERRRHQGEVLAGLLPLVRDVRRTGSAAIDLVEVASGRVDAYYERGLQPWDLAAASLVAQEAGAVVTGLRGEPAGAPMTVAGPPETVAALVALLEERAADVGP